VSHGSPATQPATAPAVSDIRALVEKAIALRSDPQQAQALMAQACRQVAQLPPGSDMEELVVEFKPDAGRLDHLMRSVSTKTMEEATQLSPHVTLHEKYRVSTYPFSGMADNGQGVIFPQPSTDKVLKEQAIRLNGKTIFAVVADLRKDTRWQRYYVSPDEAFIVLQDWLHAKPTRVLSVQTGEIVEVVAPEIDGHYYVYPFGFLRWEEDSTAFIVEVTGTFVKGPGEFLAYRELWRVAAGNGNPRQLERQEQPWEEKLTWKE
jgi:hypothetical protein